MREKKWRALDHCDESNRNNEAEVSQEAEQSVTTEQISYEWIIVRDSEGVDITTTDTQVAVSLQLGIQAAIAAVIKIIIGDTDQGNNIVQDIRQFTTTAQRNNQRIVVQGSKNVEVVTIDTDIAVNIQVLLQILLAIVVKLDVL
ncbi:spore coat protein [Bacillus sp. FJAT-27231]|uniref:spore coat protein n=1 Tax=Bacillus sp. FJAT-27231 TaxID=1679168 RepID=UPI000670B974|nr:spore coat protein [Bacillus sp. FJAT-27231]KMY54238.1 spore coat protein [Bacillus sp. FJAT-27231]